MRPALIRRLAWLVLGVIGQACAMPVMQGRTGQVLPRGAIGFAGGSATGIAPTTAHETRELERSVERHTYRSNSPASLHFLGSPLELLAAPMFSWELQASMSPTGRCEVSGFLGPARLGGELRCGTLPKELGSLDLAVSGAAALAGLGRPTGSAELRTGIDLSLSGGQWVPLLDLYFGYVPWDRGAVYLDEPRDRTKWSAYSSVSEERGEYRLSMPIGVAVEDPTAVHESTARLVFSLVPEITLAHRTLSNTQDEGVTASVTQVFALFLVARFEGVLLTEFSK